MTLPRRVVPGTTYLLTRRTLDRRFYLQPSPELEQIYEYALASAIQKYGLLLHSYVCMSDHPHEVVTDVHGVLPEFLRDLRREIALAAKQLYRIHENFWSAQKPSAVELHGEKAQIEAAFYTLLNPVSAGLVAHAAEWPSAIALPGMRRKTVRRPEQWFSEDRPETIELEVVPVPAWTGTHDEWDAWLAGALAERESDVATKRKGKPVLGRKRVLGQRPFDRPRNRDELAPSRHPVVSTGRDGPLMRVVLAGLRAWRRAYRDARERWRIDKLVAFPVGTWWVVQRAGALLG